MEFSLVITDSQDCLKLRRVGAEVDKLIERDGMEVFRLVDCCEQDEFELIERILPKNRVLLEDLRAIGCSYLHVSCLEEEIDEVRKGEEASSTSNNDNFSWLGDLKLKSQPFRLAQQK